MKSKIPDFIKDGMNIYRTKKYIVKQNLSISAHDVECFEMRSRDTYYVRTAKRDKDYETVFAVRRHIDGKRLPSTMYTRKYVK